MEQVAQRGCTCPVPGSVQGCMWLWSTWSSRTCPCPWEGIFKLTQTTLWFYAERLSSLLAPAYTGPWGYSSLGGQFGVFLCWTSWSSCQPIAPAYPGSSDWQHIYLLHQPLLAFASSADMLSMHSAPFSLSLMKMVNKFGPIIAMEGNPYDWPLAGFYATDHSPLGLPIETVHLTIHLCRWLSQVV